MPTPHVLVVDDDRALLDALPGLLHVRLPSLGVDACDCGEDALERLKNTHYAAIVSDYRMPGMDGLALLQQAKAARPDTPVIMLTGDRDERLVKHAMAKGAYDVLFKPIDRNTLVHVVAHALEVYHLKRQVGAHERALARVNNYLVQLRDGSGQDVERGHLTSTARALVERALTVYRSTSHLAATRLRFDQRLLTGPAMRLPPNQQPGSGSSSPPVLGLVVMPNTTAASAALLAILKEEEARGGVTIDIAHTATSAVQLLRQKEYDVLVCDSAVTGVADLLHEPTRVRPLVLLMAHAPSQVDDLLRRCAFAVLAQPVDGPHLLGLLNQVAHAATLRRQTGVDPVGSQRDSPLHRHLEDQP